MKKIILSDFDGTISTKDTNDSLFYEFLGEKHLEIENKVKEQKISSREALELQYSLMDINEQDLFKHVDKNIYLDKFFKKFLSLLNTNNNLDFAIISGGFENYIKYLLKKNKLDINYPIYANRLIFNNGRLKLEFKHNNIEECNKDFGICGNCKYKIILDKKNSYDKIIYIGDGLTDCCIANCVDLLYAKKDKFLEEYCIIKNIDYISYNDFSDVIESLNKLKIIKERSYNDI